MKYIQKQVNKIFFLLYFFIIPIAYSSYVMRGYILVATAIMCMSALVKGNLRVEKRFFVRCAMMLVVIIIGLLLSMYSMINTILCFLFLLIAYFSYFSKYTKGEKYVSSRIVGRQLHKVDWFYYIGMLAIVVHLFKQIFDKGISLDRFYIPCGAWDINVGALPLFAFYCYCDAKGHKVWILLALMTTYFGRGSRGSVLIFMLFIFIKLIKYIKYKFKACSKSKIGTTKKTFITIMGATIATIIFSFIWTFVVSVNDVSSYHDGLNDDSNAVRFRANVYAVQKVFGSTDFIFFGYDDDIRSALGDIDSISNYQTFMGYRLVQSHNSILNMFMKNGIIFAIIYVLLLCRLLKKYYDGEHIEYWLPYTFGAMIVHGMFITSYLIAFMVGLDAKHEAGVIEYSDDNDI